MDKNHQVKIIGAGLAGSEAAWQLANKGVKVTLYEMRPKRLTPAHRSGKPAELVCSNSFKSTDTTSASGCLKRELKSLNSLILQAAEYAKVPAGQALAVDREVFSSFVEEKLSQHENIDFKHEEVEALPTLQELEKDDQFCIVATGPLTGDSLAASIADASGDKDGLYFYDAIAPVIDGDSIDFSKCFFGNRYSEEEPGDYLNIPLTKAEYDALIKAIATAERTPLHKFEKPKYFESCLPIEVMVDRGPETLRFGPLKPVGFKDPKTEARPHAVIQLRIENKERTMFSMVGFQTKMKWGEQKRVLRMIPGLENADFLRFGSIHRNTYMNSPKLLNPNLSLKCNPRVFLAGQITGVEGYLESTSIGLVAALNVHRRLQKPGVNINSGLSLPNSTVLGSLSEYVTMGCRGPFAPMNSNWGLLPKVLGQNGEKVNKKNRKELYSKRAFDTFETWLAAETSATLTAIKDDSGVKAEAH